MIKPTRSTPKHAVEGVAGLAVQLRAGKEVTIHAHRTLDPGDNGLTARDVPSGHAREASNGPPLGVGGEEWKT
jgi:hypothetical protein